MVVLADEDGPNDIYRLTLFGMYILTEALRNFFSVPAASDLAIKFNIIYKKFTNLRNTTRRYHLR